ncbi:16S rRNA (cytosine(1402)-N(4))-methyltransferase RsmH [Chromohalobacter sp. TMW 2.2308]|uniref:Ribosomal RNA small subunit methyltransferase H n=1 Tax=Chromohalobacter moromii TaxID=2860329 RepID=A0A9X2X3I6_9GAMM|nr:MULTISPECIES: 16S rRNA (cytosine(1402)-N(4))-methyltransferase RsmH [Chromohalobacter]CDQ36475.1 Ribosomal RNA small subunit methyltransferase H [Virgibacillus halodenitrificans]MCK2043766.1 16S rRNA (cytosine(1402)-N(4))-methyltransferase RsmH [Chromohalobacter moromii]MCK2046550.1 16S rRNA (cytosine(1402)-N(4))-methyltransferase RsmH [Chromohalobacter moromii]MCT8506056.1 16S rRNA (cytosine(1402)-N(4))-methyltransferase RsmH [Chromohalobacter moromii]MCT8516109.1 16S rRNA (cytosine(1402)-
MQHRDNPEKDPLSDTPSAVDDRAVDYRHASVLLDGAVDALITDPDGCYLDGTFGRGGHSRAILERLSPQGRLLAIDRDPAALAEGATLDDSRFSLQYGRFAELDTIAHDHALHGRLSGVLLDVGVSSPQLDDPSRGFSFLRDGPLDMRMDPTQGESAADWLARVPEREMSDVFKRYGEERFARRIAKAIIARRAERPITHTEDLAELVKAAHPAWEKGKHPATRVFQAIRIHINGELEQLEAALAAALEALAPGGRLVVISFHSLEDRLVKRFIRDQARGDTHLPRDFPIRDTQLNRRLAMVGKASRPGECEVALNPRARSAVMRVARKLD